MSQTFPAPPALEFAMTISINLGKAYFVRPSQYGSERAAVYLLDGTIEGPNIKGIVVPNSGAYSRCAVSQSPAASERRARAKV